MYLGRSIDFETDLFKGCAVIFVAGLQSSPQGLFSGQRRRTAITVQGRFKQAIGFEDVVTGQEFSRPAQNLPAKWLVETVLIQVLTTARMHSFAPQLCKKHTRKGFHGMRQVKTAVLQAWCSCNVRRPA